MLRRGLTIYLAFLTAAAPCLCCCTAGRLVAAPPPTPAPASEPAAAPCCCHDAEAATDPAPAATPGPADPAPPHRCPCRDHADMPAQVVVGPAAAELALLRPALHVTFDAVPAATQSAVSMPVDGVSQTGWPDPFPSAFDLLHVHHRLRC